MEKLRIVDEHFEAGKQELPEGFDNITPEARQVFLKEFNFASRPSRALSQTEITVAWDLKSGVPKELTAERMGVAEEVIEGVRVDFQSWEARASLHLLAEKES